MKSTVRSKLNSMEQRSNESKKVMFAVKRPLPNDSFEEILYYGIPPTSNNPEDIRKAMAAADIMGVHEGISIDDL